MTTERMLEAQFRALHEQSSGAYAEEVKRWQSAVEEEREYLKADESELRGSLKASGIDLDLLDRRDQRAADRTEAELKRLRPGLLERPSQQLTDWKQRSLAGGGSCAVQAAPYAVRLIAADSKVFADVAGERSGLWVFPDNPGRIQLRESDRGSGTGCWASASPPPPTASIWWQFTPDRSGRWEISPIVAFHGFYIMRADDGYFSCKVAKARLHAQLRVTQYGLILDKQFKLIDRSEDDVNETKFYDRTEFLWDIVQLRAGDPVWVEVAISVRAVAAGGGAYAEVNFGEGVANYIEPVFLSAQPV